MSKLIRNYLKNKSLYERSNGFSLIMIGFLVLCIVVGVSYATYLFIDATQIPTIAGVHITKNLVLAFENIKGDLYSNKEKGIENWMIAEDEKDGFEFKYPNDGKYRSVLNGGEFVMYNSEKKDKQSLAMNVLVKRQYDGNRDFAREMIESKGIKNGLDWKKSGVKDYDQAFVSIPSNGNDPEKELVLWGNEKNLFLMEGTFYNKDKNEMEKTFQNIVSEFKII